MRKTSILHNSRIGAVTDSSVAYRKEDLLLLLIRGDPISQAVVKRLAEGDQGSHQPDQELREGSRVAVEKQDLEGMEHRLTAFRKMVSLVFPFRTTGSKGLIPFMWLAG